MGAGKGDRLKYSSDRFHELLKELGTLHKKKGADYGKEDDPFSNVRSAKEWGIAPWVGAMIRLNDKVKRLQKLAQRGSLVNESARDSFLDIAGYALIAHVLYEQEEQSGEVEQPKVEEPKKNPDAGVRPYDPTEFQRALSDKAERGISTSAGLGLAAAAYESIFAR